MTTKRILAGTGLAVALTALLGLQWACSPSFILNQTAPTGGNIKLVFINETPYRATFCYGIWNSLDRSGPGPVMMRNLRVEGKTIVSTDDAGNPLQIPCVRNFAIGTREFINRVIAVEGYNDVANFDPDAFSTVVHFSDQPADSELAGLPTVGTAQGVEKLVGVHYRCGDTLILTFVQDPDAAGGFRIDCTAIRAKSD